MCVSLTRVVGGIPVGSVTREAECLCAESLTIEMPETPQALALRLQQEAIASQPVAFA